MENGTPAHESQPAQNNTLEHLVGVMTQTAFTLANLVKSIEIGGLLLSAENENGEKRLTYSTADPDRITEVKPFLEEIEERFADEDGNEMITFQVGPEDIAEDEDRGPEGAD